MGSQGRIGGNAMATLRDRTIKASNVTEKDKYIKNIQGTSLNIQVDGSCKLSISGGHSNTIEGPNYALTGINMSTLEKVSNISSPGLYLFIIEGLDEIELNLSGTGTIHWKEMGD